MTCPRSCSLRGLSLARRTCRLVRYYWLAALQGAFRGHLFFHWVCIPPAPTELLLMDLDVIKTRIQSQPTLPDKGGLLSPNCSARSSLLHSSNPSPNYQTVASSPSSSPPLSLLNGRSSHETTPTRQSSLAITLETYRSEGLSVFFRGLGICSFRAFIVNAVQWAVYEWVMALLVPQSAKHETFDMESKL